MSSGAMMPYLMETNKNKMRNQLPEDQQEKESLQLGHMGGKRVSFEPSALIIDSALDSLWQSRN